ncbi:hypothetical protein PV327_000084 [Microctonus hyperodae]|uniref:Pyruvate kinase n=1 Tax=Microctonus hyperodae TaxID=165561 RepID=A0AA39L1S8_MICHY|nr:hypothetical protein PV327_000084 [Microctonus hyperodae]
MCDDAKTISPRPVIPWMMKLEDQIVPDRQLGAAYQDTRIDHEIKLNVNCNPSPARLTRIMITLGEVNNKVTDIVKLFDDNHVDMIRLNVSHEDNTWHRQTIKNIRKAIEQIQSQVAGVPFYPPAIVLDLKGPEIRTGIYNNDSSNRIIAGCTTFVEGDDVKLLSDKQTHDGSNSFWTSYRDLPRLSRVGDRIILDRGAVCLKVNQKGNEFVNCTVMKSGVVANKKIVQPIDTPLNLPQISKQDDNDIDLALELECDFLIASHTRSWKSISTIKERIKKISPRPICVLAKISTCQGIEAFNDILKVADGIVIDRESLQIEVRMEKLFLAQKSIIAKCNRVGKPVVVTYRVSSDGQMKFELDLVANAVLEGADSIFLATGSLDTKETLRLIENVDVVCREAECARWQRQIFQELSYKASIPLDPTHAMAIAAVELSMKLNASAIIVTTTTGRSAILLSIYRPRCPIIAITRYGIASRWLRIYFAIHPLHYQCPPNPNWNEDIEARIRRGMNYLRQSRFVDVGDAIVIVGSWHRGDGFTNSIRVLYFSSSPISNNITDFEQTW